MDNSFDSLLNASAVPQDEKVQAFIAESKNKDRKSTRLNSSHIEESRMPSSA